MKLKFIKNDDENIHVKIIIKQTERDFSYVEMIKQLYAKETLEPSEFNGDFSEEEQGSLISLVQQISDKVNEKLLYNET